MARKQIAKKEAAYTDARQMPKGFDPETANPDEFVGELKVSTSKPTKGRTVYPDAPAEDSADLQAKARAERLKAYGSSVWNRLQITECLRVYNQKIRERYRGDRDMIRRHSKTKLYLAAVIFPELSPTTACTYLSGWDNSGRIDERSTEPQFIRLTPRAILILCKELECTPNDLFMPVR